MNKELEKAWADWWNGLCGTKNWKSLHEDAARMAFKKGQEYGGIGGYKLLMPKHNKKLMASLDRQIEFALERLEPTIDLTGGVLTEELFSDLQHCHEALKEAQHQLEVAVGGEQQMVDLRLELDEEKEAS